MLKSLRWVLLCCAAMALLLSASAFAVEPGEGYVDVPGGQVWYRVVGSSAATPLLVLHGGPGIPSDYLFSLSDLAGDRPVVFYDQLGCGRSTQTSDPALWTVDRFVAEIDAVREQLGLNEVHLYGHSWGTVLAVEYMLTQPAGVKSLVLCGPALSFENWERDVDSLLRTFPDSLRSVIMTTERDGSYQSSAFQQAVMDFYHSYLARSQPWSADLRHAVETRNLPMSVHMLGPSPFSVTGTLKNYDCTSQLSQITVPTLLLAGDHDEVLPSTLVAYNKLFPRSEAAIVGRSGHLPTHDQPDKHNRIVRRFLKK
ncbi:MAG: proline iminopeptidase-family hydrolase, partial [candidate division Zixibacteria bacterium]|nr:proline iminopeptidase-family hydrolase [candidate division Zixibacteria bacterium]